MSIRVIVYAVMLAGISYQGVMAKGLEKVCEDLKKAIQKTLYGIKTGEDMMNTDLKMNTPEMQKAVAGMKKSLADQRAELKEKGCGSEETDDMMDMTYDQKFKNRCEKAKAEIKATQEYVGLLDKQLVTVKDAGDLKRIRKARELSLKHLRKEKEVLGRGCK